MADCQAPVPINTDQGWITVPCGKCPNCIKRCSSAWSFRLMQQYLDCQSAHFITLTYATHSVPITKNGFMDLCKTDVQKFFKRLRKISTLDPDYPIKYYLVGEYGGRTKRPHYHAIIYNSQPDTIIEAWSLDQRCIGDIHFGTVNYSSVGYTLKYMMKRGQPSFKNDDRQKNFALMSKGLGANYLTDQMILWHEAAINDRMYCRTLENKKIAMPRYYKDKLYSKDQRSQIGVYARSRMLQMQEKVDHLCIDLDAIFYGAAKRDFDLLHHQIIIDDAVSTI